MPVVELKNGQKLADLAVIYGLSSAAEIYYADCNRALRARRPDPAQVKEGDIIMIPKSKFFLIDERITKLLQLRGEMEEFHTKLQEEFKAEYKKMNETRLAIDTIADILLLKIGLVKLLYKPAATAAKIALTQTEAIKATFTMAVDIPRQFYKQVSANENGELDYGEVKEERNKEINKLLKKTGIELAADVIEAGSIKMALKKLGGSALDFVGEALSILHPSFWAEKISGVNPEKVLQDTLKNIETQKFKTTNNLDRKIMYLYEEKAKYNRLGSLLRANGMVA